MSVKQVRDIEEYFPTRPWLEVYREAIEANEELSEHGEGWGTEWEGAFVFEINSIPLAERTLDSLPVELVEALRGRIEALDDAELESILAEAPEEVRADVDDRDGSLRERVLAELHETRLSEAPDRVWPTLDDELPAVLSELLSQLEANLVDGDTVYAYLDVYDGGCREVDTMQSLDDREYGFRLSGTYADWKSLVQGEGGVIDMLMSGAFEIEGDMQKVLQYSEAAVDLADTAAEVDSRFVI